ncbi:ATP-binding protein [Streptomyces sp. HF10]|uniref:ATP-binding protein n=1 Tax=Streptomyces sp. HF10 TaxID=2692233 RepID=UPI001316A4F2|nr:ATP-binding protein [Streptomyces sp. HF10]QHC32757.1 ATP-binding protein [Streptomyces sp. HF10]
MSADLLDALQAMADRTHAVTRSRPGVLETDLQLTAAAVKPIRDIVIGHLALWGLGDYEWGVSLATSELLTNAFKHARRPDQSAVLVRLVLSRTPGGLFLGLSDPEMRRPNLLVAGDDEEGGRGIPLLHVIGEEFACAVTERGKDVWVTFATP